MNKRSSSKTSKPRIESRTDWKRVYGTREMDIDTSDLPEVTAEIAADGVVRVGGKIVPRGKKRLTIYLDAAIVEYFKAKAGERGYQTLINEALKRSIEQESLEATLRRVIREESAPYEVKTKKTT